MTHKERVAIARVLSDLVRADNILEESETSMLATFFGEGSAYRLDYDILRESRGLRLSDAVNILDTLSDEEKVELYNNIVGLALADDVCVPQETNLILAIKYIFGINDDGQIEGRKYNARMFACPTSGMVLFHQYFAYIESRYDDRVNKSISENIRFLSLTLGRYGFDLLYLPEMVERFKVMNPEYVKGVLRFISPELTEQTADVIYDKLVTLDSVSFCNNILADRLKIESVRNSSPAFLVNIGTSMVPYYSKDGKIEFFTEFLLLEVENDVESLIDDFTRNYGKLISRGAIVDDGLLDARNGKRFKYFGFYKAILDFIVMAEPKIGEVVLCARTSDIYVPKLTRTISLSPQESTLLSIIAIRSQKGSGLPSCFTDKTEMNEVCRLYKKLNLLKGGNGNYPDSIPPIISRLNKKLKTELAELENQSAFVVKNADGYYRISANENEILCAGTPHNALIGIKLSPVSAILQ